MAAALHGGPSTAHTCQETGKCSTSLRRHEQPPEAQGACAGDGRLGKSNRTCGGAGTANAGPGAPPDPAGPALEVAPAVAASTARGPGGCIRLMEPTESIARAQNDERHPTS